MALPLGVPDWYAQGKYTDQTLNQAVQEQYALAFGKKVALTLTFDSDLEEYAGEFTSITTEEDDTQYTVTTWDEGAASDTNTSALIRKSGNYIVGKFKSIVMVAGSVRIN